MRFKRIEVTDQNGHKTEFLKVMYHDMKALYTLEQLVNNHYRTLGVEPRESEVQDADSN